MFDYDDDQIGFFVLGSGAIIVDDMRVTDRAGRLVAAESVDGPTLAAGPLNLQLTDATSQTLQSLAVIRSAAVKDLDGDGYPGSVLTFTGRRPATTALPITVIEGNLVVFSAAGTPIWNAFGR